MLCFHVDRSLIKYYTRCGTLKMQNFQDRQKKREREIIFRHNGEKWDCGNILLGDSIYFAEHIIL